MYSVAAFIENSMSLVIKDFKGTVRERIHLRETRMDIQGTGKGIETVQHIGDNMKVMMTDEDSRSGYESLIWMDVPNHPNIRILQDYGATGEYDSEKWESVPNELLFPSRRFRISLGQIDGKYAVFYPDGSDMVCIPLSDEVFPDIDMQALRQKRPYDMVFLVDKGQPFKDNVICEISLSYPKMEIVRIILPFNYRYLVHPRVMENTLYKREVIHSILFGQRDDAETMVRRYKRYITVEWLCTKGFSYDAKETLWSKGDVKIEMPMGIHYFLLLSDGKKTYPRYMDDEFNDDDSTPYLWYEQEVNRILEGKGYLPLEKMGIGEDDHMEDVSDLQKDKNYFKKIR